MNFIIVIQFSTVFLVLLIYYYSNYSYFELAFNFIF